MSRPDPGTHRLPRAGLDPIADEPTALALVHAAAARPRRHETILVLLDDARRGVGLVVVHDTIDVDAVVEVTERILDPQVHDGRIAAVIVASVRPGDTGGRPDELADVDRWLDLDEIADRCCVELIEWFVLADVVSRPRELVDAAARW